MKPKLTKDEFEQIVDILIRLDKETDMCKHESMLWLITEIYQITKFAESTFPNNTN